MNRLLNRILILEAFVVLCLLFGGCSTFHFAPPVQVNVENENSFNGNANGNTVPVSAVP